MGLSELPAVGKGNRLRLVWLCLLEVEGISVVSSKELHVPYHSIGAQSLSKLLCLRKDGYVEFGPCWLKAVLCVTCPYFSPGHGTMSPMGKGADTVWALTASRVSAS